MINNNNFEDNKGGDDEVNEISQFEKRSIWDEKELEKRTEIANRFWKVGITESVNDLIDLINKSEKKYVALEMRIAFDENEYFMFDSILRDINKDIAASHSLLDSYITFSNSTPKFENMLTSLYNFHQFISGEEERLFHQIKVRDEGIYYYRAGKMNKYVKEISFLLSRLIGTLKTAGYYIIDTENETQQNDNINRFGRGGMDNINGYDRYMGEFGNYGNRGIGGMNGINNNMFDKFGNLNITKINTPKKRDFGDGND